METLVKADIFFFIASVGTVVFVILTSVLLWYLIKAGKHLSALSEVLRSDYKESEEFINDLKARLEDNIVFQFFFPRPRKHRK